MQKSRYLFFWEKTHNTTKGTNNYFYAYISTSGSPWSPAFQPGIFESAVDIGQ